MIPVKLERKEGRFNFVVSWTGEEIRGNVSIHKKRFLNIHKKNQK
jgi:hypothetical protein